MSPLAYFNYLDGSHIFTQRGRFRLITGCAM